MKCNLCQNATFGDMGSRKGVVCLACGSLERTRLMGLYLEELDTQGKKVLHIAPERGLVSWIRENLNLSSYVLADLFPESIPWDDVQRIDLCSLEAWQSDSFDLILHSHVLEHVRCNYSAVLFHLDRMLRPGGLQLAVIPFMEGYFEEDLAPLTREQATSRFGQFDHVRKFGSVDRAVHLGSVVKLPSFMDHEAFVGGERLMDSNIPRHLWKDWGHSSVLIIREGDLRIG